MAPHSRTRTATLQTGIELYNHGDTPVELRGLIPPWGRSRPLDPPLGHDFAGRIPVVFAGKDRGDGDKPLHAASKLESKGEYLALLARTGKRWSTTTTRKTPVSTGTSVLASRQNGIRDRIGGLRPDPRPPHAGCAPIPVDFW